MLESADVTSSDGRVARSQRTRGVIADALIALLEDGQVQPTIEEIAQRAGVAPRTVFQHYPDRETLFYAVSERRQARLAALMVEVDAAAPLEHRVTGLADQRVRLYEWIAPVRRASLLMEPFSAPVHAALDGFRAVQREELRRLFGRELAGRPAEDRAATEAALCAVSSFSAWEALRTHQRLDVDAARAALLCGLRALLAAPAA